MSIPKMWISKVAKISKFLLIFLVITGWIFSGWPPIWQNPPAPLDKYLSRRFPPEVQVAQAATTTIFLTTGTSWTVPNDWNNSANKIEVIGGGGGGGGGKAGNGAGSGSGGGGGAYARITNLTLTGGGSVTIQVGAAGTGGAAGANGTAATSTWFNGANCTAASTCAVGGGAGLTTSATGGAGGAAASSVGTTKFSGGSGGAGSTAVGTSGGGGGGAAGLNGTGLSAANGPSAGGSGDAGSGGAGGAAGNPAVVGGNGTEYNASNGSGGGGGGGNASATTATGGAGGTFGAAGGGGGGKAAGGNGSAGLIVISYTPAVTLTFTVDVASVTFTGGVTPGTPVSTSSVLTVNTNNATGYNVSLVRASTTPTLILSSDNATTIADTPNGNNWTAPAATSTAGPSAVWTSGTTIGLGFRVKQTGTVSNTYSSVWWGTDDTAANALYSGIATSTATAAQSMIAKTTLGSATNENTVVEYRLDVVGTQKSGKYVSSPAVFTATANP